VGGVKTNSVYFHLYNDEEGIFIYKDSTMIMHVHIISNDKSVNQCDRFSSRLVLVKSGSLVEMCVG
jgi:hypothetical protein